MKKTNTLLVALISVAAARTVAAHELATHAAITNNAYLKSTLNPVGPAGAAVIKDLGIDAMIFGTASENPFGSKYFDVKGSTIQERSVQRYEQKIIRNVAAETDTTKISGWLMRGAIREDDLGTVVGFNYGDDPHDDPYGVVWRVFNHFFDPVQNRPLTVLSVSMGETNPNWAIGTTDAFAAQVAESGSRRNHFTIYDAREAMYRALTGLTKTGTTLGGNGTPADERQRKTWWATMFRSLGDVVHLNQDMAQPQHTRNEAHTGAGGPLSNGVTGHASMYELYIDARATGLTYSIDGQPKQPYPRLQFGDHPIPTFDNFSDFWRTGAGGSSDGKGLADYSNRNFFTAANNINDVNYAKPSPLAASYTPCKTSYPVQSTPSDPCPAPQSGYIVNYLIGQAADTKPPKIEPFKISRESVWTAFSPVSVYSLDRAVYDDMANLLIPRAVAYSAGIFNHFFRGKMTISLPDEGVYSLIDHSTISISDGEALSNYAGFSKIKLKLSAPANDNNGQPQSLSGGKLIAVMKFRRNTCYKNDLSGFPPFVNEDTCRSKEEEIVVSEPGAASAALGTNPQAFEFNFGKALPLNATDVRLQVVYRGQLGTESDAVVVATQDISEPTFFAYQNASDYYAIAGSVYTRNEINASSALLSLVTPQDCVDRALSPPQLKSTCLMPFDIKVGFTIGAGSKQTSFDIDALPVKRFVRVAFLGDANTDTSLVQYTTNTCFPHETAVVTKLRWQDNYPSANVIEKTSPQFKKVRDVAGWSDNSCVGNGDGSNPGAPDNRNAVMSALPESSKAPYPDLKINGGNGF